MPKVCRGKSQNRPIRSRPIPAISIRSNEKRVWKDISSLDISMHRKSFNFWSRFPVNVCGRHSKWARDRSHEILALQNLPHFSTVSTASKIEPGFDVRGYVFFFFFNEDERIKFPPIVVHFSFIYERRKLRSRISTFKYEI